MLLLLKFAVEFFDDEVFVMVYERQVLNMIVSVFELFLQINYFLLLIVHYQHLGIDIFGRKIRNLRSPARIVQGAQILLHVLI